MHPFFCAISVPFIEGYNERLVSGYSEIEKSGYSESLLLRYNLNGICRTMETSPLLLLLLIINIIRTKRKSP